MTNSTTAVAPGPGLLPTSQSGDWMTTVLRPVGPLDRAAVRTLRPVLQALGVVRGLVLLDLSAATPISAECWRLFEEATQALDPIGGGLVIIGLMGDQLGTTPASVTTVTLLGESASELGPGYERGSMNEAAPRRPAHVHHE